VRGMTGETFRGECKRDMVSSASFASRLPDNILNISHNTGCLLIARKPANTTNVILAARTNVINGQRPYFPWSLPRG